MTDKPIVHSITVMVLDEDYDRDAFEKVFTTIRVVTRVLLPNSAIEVRHGGMVSESMGFTAGGISSGSDNRPGVPSLSVDRVSDVRKERGVVHRDGGPAGHRGPGDPEPRKGVAARMGGTALGWPDVLGPPESASDRLTGPPGGIVYLGREKIVPVALHRGRRRRLWDRFKKVSAGTRFNR